MHTIIVKPLFHRQAEQIGIVFKKNQQINDVVKKIKEVKWSQTHTCWYVPLNKEVWAGLQNSLKDFMVDSTQLKAYLERRNIVKAGSAACGDGKKEPLPPQSPVWKLCIENAAALQKFVEQLKLKAYSPSTIRTYRNEFLQLLQLLRTKCVNNLRPHDIKRYMVFAMEKQGISENTAHSRLNALKFYFEQVLGREKFFWEIPRPKKRKILPKVLGEAELRRLFAAADNLKHKAILFVAYSAGLRVSEVINLTLQDIDREREQLFIYCSKGKKDRYVRLSPMVLDILEQYYRGCVKKPMNYIFEGAVKGQPYTVRSAQQIFFDAKAKAGISKTVSFHALRHSFATHLLEKGVDIKFIKEILGHFNIKTTERYLHVKREFLINIESPIESLYRQ